MIFWSRKFPFSVAGLPCRIVTKFRAPQSIRRFPPPPLFAPKSGPAVVTTRFLFRLVGRPRAAVGRRGGAVSSVNLNKRHFCAVIRIYIFGNVDRRLAPRTGRNVALPKIYSRPLEIVIPERNEPRVRGVSLRRPYIFWVQTGREKERRTRNNRFVTRFLLQITLFF